MQLLKQWLLKCSPEPAVPASPGNLLEIQILGIRNTNTWSYPRPTESETPGGPQQFVF